MKVPDLSALEAAPLQRITITLAKPRELPLHNLAQFIADLEASGAAPRLTVEPARAAKGKRPQTWNRPDRKPALRDNS